MTKAKTRNNRVEHGCKRRNIYISDTVYDTLSKDAAQRFEAISAWIEDACKQKLQREK